MTISAVELAARLGLPEPTEEQAAVICSPLEPAVVVAGAGAGKTETMSARVVWLVANGLVAPDAVLGLTFTRKAAAELGSRIRRRLAQWRHLVERDWPEDTDLIARLRAGEPTVSTYAAYAGRLVGEQALRLGAEPDARLLSPAQCWQLADAAVRSHAGPLPDGVGTPASVVGWVLGMAGQFGDHLVTADDVDRFCTTALAALDAICARGKVTASSGIPKLADSLRHRQALLAIVREYTAAKAAIPAVDFGDQAALAARLAGLDAVRDAERARFAAVLLDEYQDTGHAQAQLLSGLFGGGGAAGAAHPVTAVGDPFQSIYGWRGASAGNLEVFDRRFARCDGSPARTYPLATSFRNDRRILRVANAVSDRLRARYTVAALRPRAGAGDGTVEVARTETYRDEAAWVAARLRAHWDASPPGERTAAVLVRRRSQIPALADAVRAAGLPVEVVGLGGLLTTPEVADVVATLRVLIDHEAVPDLGRLLTGARWRIGPRDLAALHGRARGLGAGSGDDARSAVDDDDAEPFTIVEALDDLGPAQRYSRAGYVRLRALAGELRALRRRVGAPLPELVAEVERATGVGVEVAARADRDRTGRVHLDRFGDEVARFAAEATDARGATLGAFLAYLDAADEEENGLDAGEVEVATERVQILTVHGAKGLEWDVVAVPGLVEGVFPAAPRSLNWARARHELPTPMRGDRADLPGLDVTTAADPDELARALAEHDAALKVRHSREERRLAYVAVTRARSVLLASGYVWDGNVKRHEASPFLDEVRGCATESSTEPSTWVEVAADAPNPVTAEEHTGPWPADPLGERRAAVEAGAALVRAAAAAGAEAGAGAETGPPAPTAADLPGRPGEWARDVDRLLAEWTAARAAGDVIEVPLPAQLSVSQLVELDRDPAGLARRLHRPLPAEPAPLARRGTRFHAWLEQRWQAQPLLDVDELPGAADAASGGGADDAEFDALRAAFEASAWAGRRPAEVEVPFEMSIAGAVVRGRMDAVFAMPASSPPTASPATTGWIVVDWKTGRRPTGADARAAAVQLAAYRLAWARLAGVPEEDLHRVRAAFHYVRSNETVEPVGLLDAAGLRELVAGRPHDRAAT